MPMESLKEKNLMELVEDASCWSGRGVTVQSAENTLTFLKSIGSSNDQFYSKYLEQMRLHFPLCNAIGGSVGVIIRPGGEDEIDVNAGTDANGNGTWAEKGTGENYDG